ncbi:MAG: hypothetical protein AXW16_06665 [Cycloclasticus sp. Phe_18]|nr:MAG: hypothetical protein AXW16_06665 [Cycloclasticus sp. Phe_18]
MQDTAKQEASSKDNSTTKSVAKQPKKSPDTKAAKKSGAGIAWLAIILTFCALGAGFLAYQQLRLQVNQLANNTESLKQQATNLSNEINAQSTRIDAKLDNISKQWQTHQQSTDASISLLQKQVGKNKRQWLIAEAEYLVSTANTRLLLAADIATAIVALQSADQRLKENGDPMTFAVRRQLAKEINTLKSTQKPDIVGLSSQILALEDAVSNMSISEPHAGTAQAPEIGKGEPSPIPGNIQETLNNAWENFSKLVVVRRNDKPMAALMTPERVELIRKNLALKLESARLALINQNQALYTESIAISRKWLADYFDASEPSVKTALEQLDSLENTNIISELPSIALSLKMLRELPLLAIPESNKPTPSIKTENNTTTEPETTPSEQIAGETAATSEVSPTEPAPQQLLEAPEGTTDAPDNKPIDPKH